MGAIALDTRATYCTFHLDHLYLGVEVLNVQEVIRAQKMTDVPLAQPVVKGLMNLRGQIVTALDLRHQLGLPQVTRHRPPTNVVIRTSEGSVSLLVDEIGDVLQVDNNEFEPPPETLQGVARQYILGTYKLPNKLLLILDTKRVVHLAA